MMCFYEVLGVCGGGGMTLPAVHAVIPLWGVGWGIRHFGEGKCQGSRDKFRRLLGRVRLGAGRVCDFGSRALGMITRRGERP